MKKEKTARVTVVIVAVLIALALAGLLVSYATSSFPFNNPAVQPSDVGQLDPGTQPDGGTTGDDPAADAAQQQGAYAYQTTRISALYSENKNTTYFLVNDRLLADTIQGVCSFSGNSNDGAKSFYVSEDGKGYVVSAEGLQVVANDTAAFPDAVFSADGSKLAYSSFDGSRLYIVSATGGQPQHVDDGYCSSAAFSPDGSILVYNAVANGGPSNGMASNPSVDSELRMFRDGQVKTLSDGLGPISVSDDGNTVYCFKATGKNDSSGESELAELACVNANTGNVKTICKDSHGDYTVNLESTEIVYGTESGYYYLAKDGKPQLIGKYQYMSLMLPSNAYGAKSLKGQTYQGDSSYKDFNTTAFYLDNDAKVIPVVSKADNCWLSADAQDIYYLKDAGVKSSNIVVGSLCRRPVHANDKAAGAGLSSGGQSSGVEQKLAENATEYAVSTDQSQVYFVDSKNNLVFVQEDLKTKTVAKEVDPYSLLMSADGYLYFAANDISQDSWLRCSRLGGSPQQLIENIEHCERFPAGIYVYTLNIEAQPYIDVNLLKGADTPLKLAEVVSPVSEGYPQNDGL
ncbi:MAG: hypothetical protein FWF71_02985 [Actinomycetia bacterium]|nr:hypothetical protein [Actinomycetes bacterium]